MILIYDDSLIFAMIFSCISCKSCEQMSKYSIQFNIEALF